MIGELMNWGTGDWLIVDNWGNDDWLKVNLLRVNC
jgi:hypothetical protein